MPPFAYCGGRSASLVPSSALLLIYALAPSANPSRTGCQRPTRTQARGRNPSSRRSQPHAQRTRNATQTSDGGDDRRSALEALPPPARRRPRRPRSLSAASLAAPTTSQPLLRSKPSKRPPRSSPKRPRRTRGRLARKSTRPWSSPRPPPPSTSPGANANVATSEQMSIAYAKAQDS
eukprot:Amastigsp_a513321_8.p3 type:complete len:177 gc:universal Amastigsp_a513321_8:936-406(-)